MNVTNKRHPELQPGESFLRNDADCGFKRTKAVLPSARQGQIAYNIHGGRLSDEVGLKPIFVRPDELEAAGGPLMLEVRYAEIQERQ